MYCTNNEEPIFKALHTYTYKYKGEAFKNLNAAWNGYNPWTRTLSVTVSRPITKEICILKENDDIVTKNNYKEYEIDRDKVSVDRDAWKWKHVVLDEKETVIEFIEGDDLAGWYETELYAEC